MELPLKGSAMTLFLYQILVFCSEVVHTLVTNADQVAKNTKVPHFDCGAMTEKTLYALNQVRQYHITPDELEISQTKIILYTKHFRKSSTQPSVEYNNKARSGTVDITTTVASITL